MNDKAECPRVSIPVSELNEVIVSLRKYYHTMNWLVIREKESKELADLISRLERRN